MNILIEKNDEFVAYMRTFRIGPLSAPDLLVPYLLVYLIAPLLSRLAARFLGLRVTRAAWMWLMLPFSVILHLVLRLDTPFELIALDPHGHYLAKIVLLAMIILGLRGISLVRKQTRDFPALHA